MKHLKTLLVGAGVLVASTGLASAQSATMTSSITISRSCNFPITGTTLTLGFPNSGNLTGVTTAATNSSLSVTCTSGTGYNVKLDGGTSLDSGSGYRRMKLGADKFIPYEMFRNSTYDGFANWSPDSNFLFTASGSAQTVPLFGVIRNFTGVVTAGTYTDTVAITFAIAP